jgi:hypothetical protein
MNRVIFILLAIIVVVDAWGYNQCCSGGYGSYAASSYYPTNSYYQSYGNGYGGYGGYGVGYSGYGGGYGSGYSSGYGSGYGSNYYGN